MKIWIFNHYSTTPNHVGGTRHYDLAYELIKKGHEVTIFASSFNHFQKKETINYEANSYSKKVNVNGVNYVWIKTIKYNGTLKRIFNILDYTRKAYKIAKDEIHNNGPDIVLGSSIHPLAAFIGYRISRKAESAFYFEERDLWPQTFVDFGKISKNNPISKILYSLEKFLYDRSDKIIVLFDKASKYVASRNVEKNKIIYLPNGVNIENYYNYKKDQEISNLMNSFNYKVVYTGSHGIANHLEPLIEAANLLQNKEGNLDIQFILVGNGLEKPKLIKLAKKYSLKNVTFVDSIPKEKIPFLLSLADLSFISIKKSPLYKWGFSMNKLYDYMASGLPIIMYSSKDVVGNLKGVYGVNLAESYNDLAKDILTISYDEMYKNSAGDSLKKFVRESYSWDKLALKLESHMIEDINSNNR
ncbi:glycosyltransferase family 4 protein [Halobacillus karajensis]|uniref:Glycosyl transferase n=1 Tax=Halobacillus karajensis TaxID=195088 RepID=A0A059NWS0_9BACI|nr:glycosyltransferase family 4 protein [Halobacillus karajensis]CDQ18950.1 putative glycosyl transferase [Halobacillus karajensis]CDQ22976.1 putative glycosyl transferase [Halobacillus karajensis]CDQ26459.1 putative glycosyl transferase [Halobacillus karajensis]